MQLSAQSNTSDVEHTDSLHGTVVNAITHEPIGRALVLSPDHSFATMTDDRGHFEFKFPHPSGENTFGFSAGAATANGAQSPAPSPNRPTALMARKTGYIQLSGAREIVQMRTGQQDVTISLMPEARIVGRVVLRGSDAANKVQVELFRRQFRGGRERWDSAGTATTRSGGEFRIANLPGGSYKLFTFEHMDRDPLTFDPRGQLFGYPPVYYPASSDFATAAVVELSPGETFQPTLSPVRKEYYPVKLGLANASAEPQLTVKVWPHGHPGPGFALGYDARDDSIQGLLPDGTYTVKAFNFGPATMAGEANITVRGVALAGPTLTLLPGGSIPVNVTEEFQRAETSALPNARNESFSGNNSNGSFSVSARRPTYLQVSLLPDEQFGSDLVPSLRPPTGPEDESLVVENALPGRYYVSISAFKGFVSSVTSGGVDLLRQPLVVGLGVSPPPIEITVRDDGAEVDGQIENVAPKDNNPAIFQQLIGRVYLVPMDNTGSGSRVGWIRQDGKFQMQQVPPGAYRALAFDRQRPEFEHAAEKDLAKYESKSRVIHLQTAQKAQLRLPLITSSE
jgi:hypothetical protein